MIWKQIENFLLISTNSNRPLVICVFLNMNAAQSLNVTLYIVHNNLCTIEIISPIVFQLGLHWPACLNWSTSVYGHVLSSTSYLSGIETLRFQVGKSCCRSIPETSRLLFEGSAVARPLSSLRHEAGENLEMMRHNRVESYALRASFRLLYEYLTELSLKYLC